MRTAFLVAMCWIVFVLTWLGAAIVFRPESPGAARPTRSPLRHRLLRLIPAVFLIVAVTARVVGSGWAGQAVGMIGAALCAAGIGVAIWARICLARNWGMPMTLRAEPTLVRRGPYRLVRHPIYSGLLLAMLGSALATSPAWFVGLAGAGIYFVVSLRVEEADLAARFPDRYPDYARRTKRLIPLVY